MKTAATLLLFTSTLACAADDTWTSTAAHTDPANDYGVTVANGIVGLVSSLAPLKVKDVVLGGAFDNYGRGRVDYILKVFNFMNMTLDVDGRRVDARGIAHFTQKLDMRHAAFSTEFDAAGKLHVTHTLVALRDRRKRIALNKRDQLQSSLVGFDGYAPATSCGAKCGAELTP